ncbi:DUF370 domain-containing protein [Fodinisporobacter ferrooxydans]|uniref:DUF370 domain-containing protein n=1 Tax=Fodinisporobacter ferrooxydans TaxID=2901836 RepID=A0ABY4CRA3_9BACL|nr:DUF370 domain-containing protein [Alicyclobacillaceae bacterium MYW30-H2]
MFIHLGGDVMVSSKDVIAIFDLRMKEESEETAKYLQKVEKNGKIVMIDPDDSKSFVVTNDYIYYSPISSLTLKKRASYMDELE